MLKESWLRYMNPSKCGEIFSGILLNKVLERGPAASESHIP